MLNLFNRSKIKCVNVLKFKKGMNRSKCAWMKLIPLSALKDSYWTVPLWTTHNRSILELGKMDLNDYRH